MNSKQLNFYSHPDEIGRFIKFLQEKGASVTYEPFIEKKFQIIESIELLELNELAALLGVLQDNPEAR